MLSTGGSGVGPITIDIANPVSGVGAQIQADDFGAYTAQIQAFDSSHNLLGTFTVSGDSEGGSTGTAPFLGVSSTSSNISEIVYSLTADGNLADLAINQLSLTAPSRSLPRWCWPASAAWPA